MFSPYSCLRRLIGNLTEVNAIIAFGKGPGESQQLVFVDVIHSIRDFLWRGNFEALPLFNRLYELACLQQ